jgi:alpha-galactosidase
MGFATWNAFGCDINESTVRQMADRMIAYGLRDAGYRFVNVDDCWGAPSRNSAGKLVANHARFPRGMKSLGAYLHARKFKFGIYADAGTHTCNKRGFPGSLRHEDTDARTFAQWGVDYLKYDSCYSQGVPARKRYKAMRYALNRVSRPIVYAICNWGNGSPWTWAQSVGHLWRTTRDIKNSWESMISIVHINQRLAAFAGPGHWNDPDMLEVGNPGMNRTEQRTQMSLWAMMAAPLLISTDLRRIDAWTLQTLRNRDVISIDQDPLGRQATVIRTAKGLTTYTKALANGDRAVALLNETGRKKTVKTTAAAAGLRKAASYSLRSLWTGRRTSSTGTIRTRVPAHGTVLYRVHPNG